MGRDRPERPNAADGDACVKKAGKAKGQLRVVAATAKCKTSERELRWTSASTTPITGGGTTGPAGPAGSTAPQDPRAPQDPGRQGRRRRAGHPGDSGPSGDVREPGHAAADPQQALDRRRGGLRARREPAGWPGLDRFLGANAKAADSNELDGVNSTGFARLSTISGGSINVGGIGAHSCADLNIGLGGVEPATSSSSGPATRSPCPPGSSCRPDRLRASSPGTSCGAICNVTTRRSRGSAASRCAGSRSSPGDHRACATTRGGSDRRAVTSWLHVIHAVRLVSGRMLDVSEVDPALRLRPERPRRGPDGPLRLPRRAARGGIVEAQLSQILAKWIDSGQLP